MVSHLISDIPKNDNGNKLILIVDDLESNRYILAKYLSEAGYKVIEAVDGAEALDLFFKKSPDLVLLDVNLPKLTGYQVCSTIKADPSGHRIPVILMSAAFTKEDDQCVGFQGGADAYLVAPIVPGVLTNTVRSWLRAYKIGEEKVRLQELTRTITQNAASCLFMLDDAGFATYMNPAAEEVTGFQLSELKETPLHYYIHHHHGDGSSYPMDECPLGGTYKYKTSIRENEELFIRKNGSFFPVVYSISPIIVGDVLTGAVLEFRDVTETKLAQAEVQASVARLQHERDLREQFVATLSHDLRTPLTAAKMTAHLLTKKSDDVRYVQKMAIRIAENMDRADQMILDLLDADVINAGEKLSLEVSAVTLNTIVAETLIELSTVHGERFIYLEKNLAQGYWNANGLRRILENLCSNAIKYGDAYRPITITSSLENEWVRVLVHNEGIIPPEELGTLFNKYARSKTARKSGLKGWGLGLTLVKGIAEAHGGMVKVESSLEAGTTFEVVILKDARNNLQP